MKDTNYYKGIPVGKRYNEYSKAELEVLPPLPHKDYPEFYGNPPYIWNGERWELILD